MKAEEARLLGSEELNKQLEVAPKKRVNLRFCLPTKQLGNHREVRKVKKNIARMITIIHERELG